MTRQPSPVVVAIAGAVSMIAAAEFFRANGHMPAWAVSR